jgi:hypothetical protein
MQISNVCENSKYILNHLKWSAGGWWFVWFVDNETFSALVSKCLLNKKLMN